MRPQICILSFLLIQGLTCHPHFNDEIAAQNHYHHPIIGKIAILDGNPLRSHELPLVTSEMIQRLSNLPSKYLRKQLLRRLMKYPPNFSDKPINLPVKSVQNRPKMNYPPWQNLKITPVYPPKYKQTAFQPVRQNPTYFNFDHYGHHRLAHSYPPDHRQRAPQSNQEKYPYPPHKRITSFLPLPPLPEDSAHQVLHGTQRGHSSMTEPQNHLRIIPSIRVFNPPVLPPPPRLISSPPPDPLESGSLPESGSVPEPGSPPLSYEYLAVGSVKEKGILLQSGQNFFGVNNEIDDDPCLLKYPDRSVRSGIPYERYMVANLDACVHLCLSHIRGPSFRKCRSFIYDTRTQHCDLYSYQAQEIKGELIPGTPGLDYYAVNRPTNCATKAAKESEKPGVKNETDIQMIRPVFTKKITLKTRHKKPKKPPRLRNRIDQKLINENELILIKAEESLEKESSDSLDDEDYGLGDGSVTYDEVTSNDAKEECPLAQRRFLLTVGYEMIGDGEENWGRITGQECMERCMDNTRCRSFDHKLGHCIVSNEASTPSGNGRLMKEGLSDYYEKICLKEAQDECSLVFTRIPQVILTDSMEIALAADNLTDCLTKCIHAQTDHGFRCRSGMFFYEENPLNCVLNSENKERRPDLLEHTKDIVDYFDNECGSIGPGTIKNIPWASPFHFDETSEVLKLPPAKEPKFLEWTEWSHWSLCAFGKNVDRVRYQRCGKPNVKECPEERRSCDIALMPQFPWLRHRNQLKRLHDGLINGKAINALNQTINPCAPDVCCQVFRGCRIGLEFSSTDSKLHWCSNPCENEMYKDVNRLDRLVVDFAK